MVLIRPNRERIDTRFLRYWLNSPVMARHLEGFRDGSVAERLNLPTIRGLAVPVLPLPEQQAIAAVLGALDDKIELNRRMSATLEEIRAHDGVEGQNGQLLYEMNWTTRCLFRESGQEFFSSRMVKRSAG